MPNNPTDIFNVGATAHAVGADPENQAKIIAASEAIYYKNASDVDKEDTELAKGSSVTTEETLWIISKGTESKVFVEHLKGPIVQDLTVTDDLKVSDTLAVTGTTALTGAVTPTGGVVSSGTLPGVFAGNYAPVAVTTGTDTTMAEKKLFLTSLWLPANKTLTGIGILQGSVGEKGKIVVGLFNASGEVLAKSTEASEGTTQGAKELVQKVAFTETYAAVGPKLYYIGVTGTSAEAKFRTIPTGVAAENIYAGEVELAEKNKLAKVTAPTTFTGGKGPVGLVY